MRYHWIRDQVKLGFFKATWKVGKLNLVDFFTKAHPWIYVHMTEADISNTRSEDALIDK